MPILLPPAPDAPLSQGDVLTAVRTFATDTDGEAPVEMGAMSSMVMVVSRPCNAVRDESVIVAPIVKRSLTDVRGFKSVEDTIRFFQGLRDGRSSPDMFYLGELDSSSGARWFAKCDALYTILVPKDPTERAKYLQAKRKFSLNIEFVRDLHLRLFRAFASLGFDDVQWWTDADLEYIVQLGEAELLVINAEIKRCAGDITGLQIGGGSPKQITETEKLQNEKRKAADKLQQVLAPLQAERARRGSR